MPSDQTSARQYDAVIFDLLTALLDSWTLWNCVAGSEDAGLRWRREYLVLTYEAGPYRPYEDIVRDAAAKTDISACIADRLLNSWTTLAPWPEAGGVLDELRKRVPVGIATNSSDRLAEIAVRVAGGGFAAVATAESAGFYKPRPEPYRQAIEQLGVSPDRILFVAGSAADVPGASGVGMPVYWHNRMDLPAVGNVSPRYMERSLLPLLALI